MPKPAAREPVLAGKGFFSSLLRFLISAFILWQLLMITFWLMPPSATQQLLYKPLHSYLWMVGCDQNWNMFSPNPSDLDVYMSAQITYQNGTQKTWVFPRMHSLGILAKYQQERFRKFIENAHLDVHSAVWPYVAKFAARANNNQPTTNPVVHVELIRTWQVIPAPPMTPTNYTSYTFYRADYPPGSLSK